MIRSWLARTAATATGNWTHLGRSMASSKSSIEPTVAITDLAGAHAGSELHLDVRGTPTHCLVWKDAGFGRGPIGTSDNSDDSAITTGSSATRLSPPRRVLVMIPGNPGLPDYYHEYLTELRAKADPELGALDIYCPEHLGHGVHAPRPPRTAVYSLDRQIAHKMHLIDSIRAAYPTGTRIHLAGHSVGSWIMMQALKVKGRVWAKNAALGRVVYLFPTVDWIRRTPNGRTIGRLTGPIPRAIAEVLAHFLVMLPAALLLRIVQLVTTLPAVHATTSASKLVHPAVVRNTLSMAEEEMVRITDLDVAAVGAWIDRTAMYYGKKDGWVPTSRYETMKMWWPDHPDIVLCNQDFAHAFVLEHGKPMAEITARWLDQYDAEHPIVGLSNDIEDGVTTGTLSRSSSLALSDNGMMMEGDEDGGQRVNGIHASATGSSTGLANGGGDGTRVRVSGKGKGGGGGKKRSAKSGR
ncbi:hypothetical protein BC828DRAFT_381211 [Blastocladiella britannica]|nr:hypothetical protein BC828DRAFT_381211 [Blastocladiella britannica]